MQRIIRGLDAVAGGKPVKLGGAFSRHIRQELGTLPKESERLPQDILWQIKRVAKAEWNEERMRVVGVVTDEQPFATAVGGRVIVYLPPIPSVPRRKVYLPLHNISPERSAEALKNFMLAHPDCRRDERGHYYIAPAAAPDYGRIRQEILRHTTKKDKL